MRTTHEALAGMLRGRGDATKEDAMHAERGYDSTLQMFVEGPLEPDFTQLAFLRWHGEHRRLEHEIYGPSSGDFVNRAAVREAAEREAALPLAS